MVKRNVKIIRIVVVMVGGMVMVYSFGETGVTTAFTSHSSYTSRRLSEQEVQVGGDHSYSTRDGTHPYGRFS